MKIYGDENTVKILSNFPKGIFIGGYNTNTNDDSFCLSVVVCVLL